jgi:hypothetical protein
VSWLKRFVCRGGMLESSLSSKLMELSFAVGKMEDEDGSVVGGSDRPSRTNGSVASFRALDDLLGSGGMQGGDAFMAMDFFEYVVVF